MPQRGVAQERAGRPPKMPRAQLNQRPQSRTPCIISLFTAPTSVWQAPRVALDAPPLCGRVGVKLVEGSGQAVGTNLLVPLI
jgi:hypothetical protein